MLLIALLFGAVGYRLAPISEPREPTAPQITVGQYDVVQVPVPAAVVPAGTSGESLRVKYVLFPKHQLPPDAITDLSQISGYSAAATLPANLPLYRSNFVEKGLFKNPVEQQIPPGMRAMTIRVDATSSVEGWAGSGAMIDVLLVTPKQTTVVAERVKVLSAERSTAPLEGAVSPQVPSTVTILVNQEQCLSINMAIPLGKIALVLRNRKDDETWQEDRDFTADGLLKGSMHSENTEKKISGFISVKDSRQKYALRDGSWIKADSIPDTYRIGDDAGQ
jgi:Flp pilus assembly protein CpaB